MYYITKVRSDDAKFSNYVLKLSSFSKLLSTYSPVTMETVANNVAQFPLVILIGTQCDSGEQARVNQKFSYLDTIP